MQESKLIGLLTVKTEERWTVDL